MQHPIDLLPEAIRARSQAGVHVGRGLAALALAVIVVVTLTTHSRIRLNTSRAQLDVAQADANLVLQAEARQAELLEELARCQSFVDGYEAVALPLALSRLLATVVNQLPASAALDRIDLEADVRKGGASGKGGPVIKIADKSEEARPPRQLSGEMAGFAETDEEIAELVARLERSPLFRDVKLDYSRTRSVRDRNAREFRVSFKVDLDCRYEQQAATVDGAEPAPAEQQPREERVHADQ